MRFSVADFFLDATVAGVAKLLGERGADRATNALREGDPAARRFAYLNGHVNLPANVRPPDGIERTTGRQRFFVTGGTGFVGVHVIADLLRAGVDVDALVRCRDPRHGEERIISTCTSYRLPRDDFRGTLRVVPGDASKPQMGIEPDLYETVAHECDAIIHSAAQVNFVYPFEALRRINVGGTIEAVQLAFRGRLKPLHYVSTCSVWPMGPDFNHQEDDSLDHGVLLNLGYDESKWVCEKILRIAERRGLPLSIFRAGEISGHSERGDCPTNHMIWAALKTFVLELRDIPTFDELRLNLAPVDYVSGAMTHIVLNCEVDGRAFHLSNPNHMCFADLTRFLNEQGYYFDMVGSYDDWWERVTQNPRLKDTDFFPYVGVWEGWDLTNIEQPLYDCRVAQAALFGGGIECPPVDGDLLSTYFDYFRDIGYFPPPPRGE